MGIDEAYDRFRKVRETLPPDDDRPIADNEACTRVHLIDPLLESVLGWSRDLWVVEPPGGESIDGGGAREGRVDYVLHDKDGVCWLLIEAKKRSTPIVETLGSVRGAEVLRLTGPVLSKHCWSIVSRQMSPYLGRYMPCFGVVTTGEQWVGFLAKLRAENVTLEACDAIVFRSLEDIDEDFELFYELFSIEGAQRRTLVHQLQPGGRGLVRAPHARRVVPPGAERPIDYQSGAGFYEDLRLAMDAAFRPLRSDRQALAACFVESRESREAGSRLERVANELGEVLRNAVEYYPQAVQGEVGLVAGDLAKNQLAPGGGFIARLLGEKSAGKTVFLDRFFNLQLSARRKDIVLLWLDVERLSPFNPDQASRRLLAELVAELFDDVGPSWEHIREIYRREWNQHLRLVGISENEADQTVRQAFVRDRQNAETSAPHDALQRYAAFASKNRKRLVCIVVDNLDHLQDPGPVIEWAVATHLSTFAMTTIAMEDATLWRLRRGVDQLSDHQADSFWLHRPKVREVLQNRCEYLKQVLSNTADSSGRTSTVIGRRGQWRWSVSADDLVRTVSAVLLENEQTARWIGEICNYNLREVLDVCQEVMLSPHVRAERLLTMQVAQQVSRGRILRTLIAPKNEQFRALPTDRVVNIFGFWMLHDFAPLLPGRVLALLREREDDDRNKREPFAGFVGVSELAEIFESAARVPRVATFAVLRHLSTMRVVEPFNPADISLDEADARVKITPRGRLHLEWATAEPTYLRLMAEVDPIVSLESFSELRDQWRSLMDALAAKNTYEASHLERSFASTYVSYLLSEMNACSRLIAMDAVEPVREFERSLSEAWIGSVSDN
jgi:hypothetical protein